MAFLSSTSAHCVDTMAPSPAAATDRLRIIAHLDVDAFYVAAERELRKEWKGRPLAVSQYNPYGSLADIGVDDPARVLYDGERGNSFAQKHGPNVNGSLIAVSYEARAKGVQRNDRGLVAIQKCPQELVIVQVPVLHGKANLTIYRDASQRLLAKLVAHMHQAVSELSQGIVETSAIGKTLGGIVVEKASIDEVYLDLSKPIDLLTQSVCKDTEVWSSMLDRLEQNENELMAKTTIGGLENEEDTAANRLSKSEVRKGSHLQASESSSTTTAEETWWKRGRGKSFDDSDWSIQELALAIGAWITLRARQSLTREFDDVYTLSAGISTNKTMAKLASGLKKPNRQTLVNPADQESLQKLFYPLPIGRIKGLGGKFGDFVSSALGIQTVGELAHISLETLQTKLDEEKAAWLHAMSLGHCTEEVSDRTKAKRIGAGKTFRGHLAIRDSDTLRKWIGNLCSEVLDRVSSDAGRYPKSLTCWLHLERIPKDNGNSFEERKANRRSTSLSTNISQNITHSKCAELALTMAKQIIDRSTSEGLDGISIIGMEISATNFDELDEKQDTIMNAFRKQESLVVSGSQKSNQEATKEAGSSAKEKFKKGAIVFFSKPNASQTTGITKATETGARRTIQEGSSLVESSGEELPPTSKEIAQCEDTAAIADDDLKYAQRLQDLFDKEHNALRSVPTSSKRRRLDTQTLISSFVKKGARK